MWIGLIIILVCGIIVVGMYNGLVKERNFVEEAFSTIDVYLKKRYDLLPNLVETVKGYASHEKETLENVIAARNNYSNATTIDEKIQNENAIAGTLGRLFALQESYPDLKANTNFQELQGQMVKIEEDILQARKYYNGVTREFNTHCETFPSNIVAGIFKFKKFPFFNITDEKERENVKVVF